MPSIARNPSVVVSWAMRPNTATGARRIAQRTTVMQICWRESSRSSMGLDFSGAMLTRAMPTMIEKITTWSIWPSTIASSGLPGNRPIRVLGSSSTPGMLATGALSWGVAAGVPRPIIILPGLIRSPIQRPIDAAMAVVTTKKPVTLRPSFRSCSRSSLAASPRTTEAITRGITIIWIVARNNWPGKASQLPIKVPVSGSTSPTEGPRSVPVIKPRNMPIKTFSHSFPCTSPER